ncbi:hypothetical protein [Microbacterium sp. SORGH_AS_0862]|uniref:alginate O-acetyltransferase AlgX-related protein n=1 Tax=Microbacterium sp. SORGH_AS_0862 TaxID=3041789 RepID=UPI00278D693B|nr:hypothetical protein [Microbacterium sp. SORGH_AS_0862]MDQ1204244.1 hypothetical protein [Microbacterium sp. SORGH_AS_0862]
MSATGGADVVHGARVPTPRWWRPYRDVPLVIVGIASLVAAIVGWTVQARLDADAAVIAPVTSDDAATLGGAACRPASEAPATEPWISDPSAANDVWRQNADALAGPVVSGLDGWAFYNDQVESNFSQAVGRRLLTVTEVAAWRNYFASIAKALDARGIELSIQVTPSASSVYPEKLPEWAQGVRGSTPLDQLLAASPDLPMVDFRPELRDAARDDAVFTPVNSHWTDWGGYVGWQTYARCHAALYPAAPAVTVPETVGVESTGIFNEYASYGIPDAGPAWTAPRYATEPTPIDVTDGVGATTSVTGATPIDLLRLPATTRAENPASAQTALVLRDSMGNALSSLWAHQYAQTWQIQHRYDDWSNPPNFATLVDQYKPNVVIIQLAERHLVNAPPTGSGF